MADPRDEIINRNAEWALTFPGSTNIAQRQRRARDVARGEELRQQRGVEATESLLRADKGARDLFLGRERLEQGEERLRQAGQRAMQQQTNFETTQERLIDRDTYQREMQTRKLELDELNAQRMMKKDLRDTENARRVLNQTIAAEDEVQELLDSGLLPGSEEFARRALGAVLKNPYLDPKARASILGGARIIGDPEELEAALQSLPPGYKPTISRDSKGGWRMTASQENPTERLSKLREEYGRISDRWEKIKDDNAPDTQFDRSFLRSERLRLQEEITATQGGLASPDGTPAPIKTASPSSFKTPSDVQAAFKSGALDRESARRILTEQFGGKVQ